MARTTVSSFFYAFTFLQILASSQAAWLPRTNVLPRQAGAPPPAAIPPQCESVCTPALAALQVCIVSRFWFMAVIIELVDFELPGMHPSYSVLYVLTPFLSCLQNEICFLQVCVPRVCRVASSTVFLALVQLATRRIILFRKWKLMVLSYSLQLLYIMF